MSGYFNVMKIAKMMSIKYVVLVSLMILTGTTQVFANGSPSSYRLVISDVDDTLRISNSNSPSTLIYIRKNLAFIGMSALCLGALDEKASFNYVSAAPEISRSQMSAFFPKNFFPEGELFLKGPQSPRRTFDYKTQMIEKLILDHPQAQVVLVGDDQQVDPEIFSGLVKKYPERIQGAFVHVIQGRKLPSEVRPYLIPAELAVLFLRLGWIRTEHLNLVYQQTMALEDRIIGRKELLPSFQICPKKYSSMVEKVTEVDIHRLEKLVEKICK